MARSFKLGLAEPPQLTAPAACPEIPGDVYGQRIAAARRRAAEAGMDALVVYGDREHVGNLVYLSGYDPRFEEGLLVLSGDEASDPILLVGNEGGSYARVSPLKLDVRLCQSFSLIDQDRSERRSVRDVLAECGIAGAGRVGLAGWKTFSDADSADPEHESEVPAFIVDALADLAGGRDRVVNATGLLMSADGGLRTLNDAAQIAAFEFAATHASQGVLRAIRAIEPGVSEHALAGHMGWIGQPLNYHPIVASGERTALGLASPSGRKIAAGDPLFMTMGGWGANSVRAGYVAFDASGLPSHDRDWLDVVLTPYCAAMVTWYESLRIGARCGDIVAAVEAELGGAIERYALNPGHLTHVDEWLSSPFFADSQIALKSGMALQMDIIPVTSGGHFGANAEDGVVLADAALRQELANAHPAAWQRMQARRAFAVDTLGIRLAEEVLPTSDILGWVPPYLRDPSMVMLPA